jgi:hypothetical protein
MVNFRIGGLAAILAAVLALSAGCGRTDSTGTEDNKRDRLDGNLAYARAAEGTPAEPAQRLADALAVVEGLRTAHVFLAGDHAYVAVTLQNPAGRQTSHLTPENADKRTIHLNQRVEAVLKQMDPSLRQVHVTERNADLRTLEGTGGESKSNGGHSRGLIRELSEWLSRTIPDWAIGNRPPPR